MLEYKLNFHFLKFFFFFPFSLSVSLICLFRKIPSTDRIDNFHLFGRTQQGRFVIYRRGLIFQEKHISKFIQQRKPDEGL